MRITLKFGREMKIQPIYFLDNLPIKEKKHDEKINNTNDRNKITEFPSGYGNTNIAFCGKSKSAKAKSKSKPKVGLEEFSAQYKKALSETDYFVPYFEPYKESVQEILTHLCAGQPCLVVHSDNMDSKELLIHDIRKSIDNGHNQARHFGLPRGIPIVTINCADYSDKNSVIDYMTDEVVDAAGNDRAIIVADEADTLFDLLDRPYDFYKSSLFKKYPTIFLIEDKFIRLTQDDLALINSNFITPEQRAENYPDLDYNKYEALKQASKQVLMQQNRVGLPSIKFDEALAFLKNPVVQRHILSQDNDITFDKKVIEAALSLATAKLYYTLNHFGSGYQGYIMNEGAIAFDAAISLLKKAAINAANNNSTVVGPANLLSVFPDSALELTEKFKKDMDEHAAQKAKAERESAIADKEPEAVEAESEYIEYSNFSVIRNSKTKFSDIGGMFNVKKQLKEEFLDIFKNDKIKNSQKPNGILLYGPPGCGKTLLAKAIAGEAGVPFISTAGSSFIEIYVGTGPKRVRELYEVAREEAANHPSKTAIVFIDEVDAAAGDRRHSGTDEDTKTVDALLHEMDGTKNKGDSDIKIVTIIATNNKNMLDGAITRSGRIDVKCYIDDPRYSEKARLEILKIHSKDLPFKNDKEKEKLINELAKTSSGMSGADLAEVIKKAYRLSLRAGRKNIITQEDINEAKMRIQAGIKTDMETSDYERKQTFAREAGKAVNSMILEKIFEGEKYKHKMPTIALDFISNSARGGVPGSTYFKPSENKIESKESLFADVVTLYGSYAVETQLFDTHTTKVQRDMAEASEIIASSVVSFDFGTNKRFLSLNSLDLSSLYAGEIKEEIENFSRTGMNISQQMIKFAKPFIEQYVDSLMKSDVDREITSEEFKNQFSKWIEDNNKKEEYETLCKNIKEQITSFCSEKGEEKAKLGF